MITIQYRSLRNGPSEIYDWCKNNCLGKWYPEGGDWLYNNPYSKMYFELEKDAILFALTWS